MHDETHGRLYNAIERVWERVLGLYASSLGWAMRAPAA